MTRSILVELCVLSSNARADTPDAIVVPEASGVAGAFHDRNIRKAFPALKQSDTKLSVCTNTMMSGASRITYFGIPTDHEVMLKTCSCQSAERDFVTTDGVSYQDAAKVISTYKANGIANAPEYLRTGWNHRQVRVVARTAHGFRLVLGDYLCAGCTAKIDVSFDVPGSLVLEQVLEAGCI